MAEQTSFDIIYLPVPYVEQHAEVMARGVRAANRVNALLKYVRDELDFTVDALEMYDAPYKFKMDCGCDISAKFDIGKVSRIVAWRTGDRTPTSASIERSPCEKHGGPDWDEQWSWHGEFQAWTHDPKRQDRFTIQA